MIRCLINGERADLPSLLAMNFHGHSVFTTICSRDKKPILWPEHWQRLKNHAEAFGYALPHEEYIHGLVMHELNELDADQKLRVILSRRHFMLTFEPYQSPNPRIYEGNERVIFSTLRTHPQLAHYKTGNSLPYSLALEEAHNEGAFEALLLNHAGYVVDGSRTSIMVFEEDIIYSLEGGLKGIMREEAIRFAENHRIRIVRTHLKPEEIRGQILLANCLIGVVPIGSIKSTLVKDMVNYFRKA